MRIEIRISEEAAIFLGVRGSPRRIDENMMLVIGSRREKRAESDDPISAIPFCIRTTPRKEVKKEIRKI